MNYAVFDKYVHWLTDFVGWEGQALDRYAVNQLKLLDLKGDISIILAITNERTDTNWIYDTR